MKPIHWRAAARRDLDDAAAWYAQQSGLLLETRFIAALETTAGIVREHIVREHPAAGSARHAEYVPGLPTALRFLVVGGFERYLLYYLDLPTHIEVLRVWNAARGLEALLEDAS